MQLIAARLLLITVLLGPLLPAVGGRRLCCLFLLQFFRFCCSLCCGCCGATTLLLPVGRPALLRSPPWPPLRMYVLTMRRRDGRQPRCWVAPEAKVCAGCFVNNCCLWASLYRCKQNFRGLGVYVPRSVDWHPALWCIISLIPRNTDGNQVAPLTREHPRRRYTPVDYPWPLREWLLHGTKE